VFCPTCGKQNSDGAVFCAGCGTNVSTATAATNSALQQGLVSPSALFMQPVLQSVSRRDFFWTSLPLFLKIVSGLLGLSGVIIALRVLVSGFQEGSGAASMLGAFASSVALGLGTYMLVHSCLIRAQNITDLTAPDRRTIPVFSVFTQLVGEIYAIILVLTGTLALLASLLPYGFSSGFMQVASLAGYSSGAAFFTGMIAFIVCLMAAFLSLFVFHFIARMIIAFDGIATDTSLIRDPGGHNRATA